MIKIVVFDMDGVLCRDRIERRLARLASWSGQRPEVLHAAIWRSGFEDEAERGAVSADDYLRGFGERLGDPLSAAQWVEAGLSAYRVGGAAGVRTGLAVHGLERW